MRLIIIVEAPTEELADAFSAGPRDLKEHFLPQLLGVKPERITTVRFVEERFNGVPITRVEAVDMLVRGIPYEVVTHKDNITPPRKEEP